MDPSAVSAPSLIEGEIKVVDGKPYSNTRSSHFVEREDQNPSLMAIGDQVPNLLAGL